MSFLLHKSSFSGWFFQFLKFDHHRFWASWASIANWKMKWNWELHWHGLGLADFTKSGTFSFKSVLSHCGWSFFPFLFLILIEFFKGFQMRYHLFLNSVWKVVKLLKMISPKSAVRRYMSGSVKLPCNFQDFLWFFRVLMKSFEFLWVSSSRFL